MEEQMRHEKELAERRRLWEEDFARQKEQERLQEARDELAREKKRRLDSWMSGGGDPADFDRAWPSMMGDIMEARFATEEYAKYARVEDVAGGGDLGDLDS